MFSELTDEQIINFKSQIVTFLQGNNFGAVQTVSDDSGQSLTFNYQNAMMFLKELTKEQNRRRRGSNPFIAVDLR